MKYVKKYNHIVIDKTKGWDRSCKEQDYDLWLKIHQKTKESLQTKYKNGQLKGSWIGKIHTKESKQKISNQMKRRHLEGKAYIIGTKDRHLKTPSIPEQWLSRVLKNGNIQDFVTEFRVGKWFIDFAFPKLKQYLEIDGEQHSRYPQKLNDIEKNFNLSNLGWKGARISWKDVFENPKTVAKLIVTSLKNNSFNLLNDRYDSFNLFKLNNVTYSKISDKEISIEDCNKNNDLQGFSSWI